LGFLIGIQQHISAKRGPAACRLRGIATDGGWTDGFKVVAPKMQHGSHIVLGRQKRYDNDARKCRPWNSLAWG